MKPPWTQQGATQLIAYLKIEPSGSPVCNVDKGRNFKGTGNQKGMEKRVDCSEKTTGR